MITLQDIQEARGRLAPYIVPTALLRLHQLDAILGCQVYVKLESMQITGAFKLRGGMNCALTLTPEQLERGIITPSSGNHGRAIAYTAKQLGTRATIVMPDNAPEIKLQAIRDLGGQVIQCETAKRFALVDQLAAQHGYVIIPPYDHPMVIAGQGTIGLEILEQCSDLTKIVVPVSGGGMLSGISTAVQALSPHIEVYGAEPAPMPRYGVSLANGQITTVDQKPTIADALVSRTPGKHCFPCVTAHAKGVVPVDDPYLLKGMKLLLLEGKLLAEPSACIGIGAVLQGTLSVQPQDRVCFVISGGTVSMDQITQLQEVSL